jgi:hypothetical protein
MKKIIFSLFICISGSLYSQSVYEFFGGPSIANQNINGQATQPLFGYHLGFGVEDISSLNYGLFARLGYHQRGSSVRFRFNDPISGALSNQFTRSVVMHNIALSLGGKKYGQLTSKSQWYYFLAVRGEYTAATKFEIYENWEQDVRRWNAGASIGGGLTFPIGKLGGALEFGVHPDFTNQIFSPPGIVRIPEFNINQQVQEQRIRNLTFELSLFVRLLPDTDVEEE